MKRYQLYLLGGIAFLFILFFVLPNPSKQAERSREQLEAVEVEAITSIVINNLGETISLYKQAGRWGLGDRLYPVDESRLDSFLEKAVATWNFEVVSTSSAYHQYGLSEEDRIEVILKGNNDETLRHVYIGKTGNRYQSRFIQQEGDDRIFQTLESLGFTFDIQAADLRDKNVLDLASRDVQGLTIAYGAGNTFAGPRTLTLRRSEVSPAEDSDAGSSDSDSDSDAEDDTAGASEATPETIWRSTTGMEFESGRIDDLLNTITALRARGFVDDEDLADYSENILIRYTLKTEGESAGEMTVVIIERNEDEGYLTGIEGREGLFYIPINDGERLEVNLAELNVSDS